MALYSLHGAIRVLTIKYSQHIRIDIMAMQGRCFTKTSPRLEKVLEELKRNPYYDKYAEKIAKFQQTSPDEFLQRIDEQEKKIRKTKEKREQERRAYESQAKSDLESGLQKKEARLSDVMKIDMIQDKTKEEIAHIWQEYHKNKDCICGILMLEQYNKMFDRGKKYPTFLLPLPRSHGYEFIMSQFYGTEIHMTPLIWYQTHKENSPECLTMVHYTELKDSKEIILMRGDFDTNYMNVQEAQCLVNELQLYYSTDNTQRLNLLETFTERPHQFKHMELITQLETIPLKSSA